MTDASALTGDLLATVRFADTKWFPGDWTKALLIFERCLVYSGGRTSEFLGRSAKEALNPLKAVTRSTQRWYDERVATDANRGLSELLAAHPENWIIWSTDIAEWDLRGGMTASRLNLELVDGTSRKVLWGRYSNSLPSIRTALQRALPDPRPVRDRAANKERSPNIASEQGETPDFSLGLGDVVSQELRLVPAPNGAAGAWSLNAGDIPVAQLRFGHDAWALDVTCKDGQWRLTNRKRFGWELNLGRPDGESLGSYYGRRWRSGGSIELADGARAELRRSPLSNRWQVQDCEIRSNPAIQLSPFGARPKPRMTVTLDPKSAGSKSLPVVVLTACGVVMLTDAVAAAASRSDLGR